MALFQPITHPILKSVDPKLVVKFLEERSRYEEEVYEKKKEVPTMSVASFKVSVDRELMENMHFLGGFDTIAPGIVFERLTEQHYEDYIRGLVKHEGVKNVNPSVINSALSNLRVKMSIEDSKARMLEFCNDAFKKLTGVGYRSFKNDNPEKMIKLLQEKLYPVHLKEEMREHLEFQGGLKKDLKAYIRLLCTEAEIQDRIQPKRKLGTQQSGKQNGNDVKNQKEISASGGSSSRKGNSGGQSKSKSDYRPLCLNPKCKKLGLRHYVQTECTEVTAEEAKKLYEEHLAKKKSEGRSGNAKTAYKSNEASNSAAVMINFANTIRRTACADSGSDTNLMPPSLLDELLRKGADVRVRKLDTPQRLSLAVSADKNNKHVYVTIDKVATLTIELLIRHGKSLTIRDLSWDVANEEMDTPLLGRPVLECLGLNTQELLIAACDRFGGDIEADKLMDETKYISGSVARRLTTGVFHSDGGVSDDEDMYESEEWCDLGKDTPDEINVALKDLVAVARENGMTNEGALKLKGLLVVYKDIFRVKLGNDKPANVEPMVVSLRTENKPFAARARRYSQDQREFMIKYMDKLESFGFIKPNPNSAWAAAPLLVPKAPPANFRLTFDLRRVNACTVPVAWPMPHIESELLDVARSNCFSTIDFCSGYWQLPLADQSQETHSFLTPKGIYSPTRTLQGAMNSGANFQAKVEPCFKDIRANMLAWLDDFLIHAKDEIELLKILESFFEVCSRKGLKLSAKKSVLFTLSVKWCGRLIDSKGVRCDPRRLSGLLKTHEPKYAEELCQYVYCLQWMSGDIPKFAERVNPLRQILEAAYQQTGSRKKRSIKGITLKSLGWSTEHSNVYESLQLQIQKAVTLAHRNTDLEICAFTDASDEHWAGVLTQCHKEELCKPFLEQTQSPLALHRILLDDI